MENRAHILVSVMDAFFLLIYTIWENLMILQPYLNGDDSLFKAHRQIVAVEFWGECVNEGGDLVDVTSEAEVLALKKKV